MVKSHIILLLFLINLFVGSCSAQKYKIEENIIEMYLNMNIKLSQDTVSFNQEITISLIFENKTDSAISFYPKSGLVLDKYYMLEKRAYGNFPHTAYFLSSFVDIKEIALIDPYGSYLVDYKIKIDKPLFKKGDNKLYIRYTCRKFSGKNEKYNLLYGHLYSAPFEIYVNDE